jgi:catalase
MDDLGIPANYRHMEGFGVHTFKLLAGSGRETLVKFHWKPTCGEGAVCHLWGQDAARMVEGWEGE